MKPTPKSRKRNNRFLLLSFLPLLVHGQKQLDYFTFLELVKRQNPLVQSAYLNPSYYNAYARKYRGIFDPSLSSFTTSKFYEQKHYYTIQYHELKIPTWTGITLKGFWELNRGLYLNPEQTVPVEGLSGVGIEMPLLQGLLVNQGRVYYRIAGLYHELGPLTRNNLLNSLFHQATQLYWTWFQAYHTTRIYREVLSTLEQQMEWIRISAESGAKPFVDTLKIYSQYTYYQLALQKAQVDYAMASADLFSFLWNEPADSLIPQPDTLLPQFPPLPSPAQLDSILHFHPYLRILQKKIAISELELRWNREQLKPQLNFNYSFLTSGPFALPSALSASNYKWGLTFYFPLFMRKARGEAQMTSIQLQMQQYEYWFKKNQIRNTCLNYFQILEQLQSAMQSASQNVASYQKLVQALLESYQAGADDLINLNFVQLQYVESQIKWIEIIAKYGTAYGNLLSYLGLGYQFLFYEEG